MRVFGVDPGALRLGYAFIDRTDEDYSLVESGIMSLERSPDEPFGLYRRRLISYWTKMFPLMLHTFEPNVVAFEILPAVGGGNFSAATQDQLAKVVATVCQTICELKPMAWEEYAANTVKKRVTGNGRATKVGIRNGITQVFPHLASRKKDLTDVADEADAVAIALVGSGYKFGTNAKASDPQGSATPLP